MLLFDFKTRFEKFCSVQKILKKNSDFVKNFQKSFVLHRNRKIRIRIITRLI
jgi:hypothetical protein